MDAPRRSSRGGSHRERRSRARALGNKQGIDYATFRFALKDVSAGEAETRAESARGRSAGDPSRASRTCRLARPIPPDATRVKDEARIRSPHCWWWTRTPGRSMPRTKPPAPPRKAAISEREVLEPRLEREGEPSNSQTAAERTAAFPSSRRARGEHRREKRSARASGTGWDAAVSVSTRRRGFEKQRRARRGRRLVHRGRPAGHRVRSGGRARVEPVCRCIERRRRRRFRDLALLPRVVACGDDEQHRRPGRREPPKPARVMHRASAHRGSPRLSPRVFTP